MPPSRSSHWISVLTGSRSESAGRCRMEKRSSTQGRTLEEKHARTRPGPKLRCDDEVRQCLVSTSSSPLLGVPALWLFFPCQLTRDQGVMKDDLRDALFTFKVSRAAWKNLFPPRGMFPGSCPTVSELSFPNHLPFQWDYRNNLLERHSHLHSSHNDIASSTTNA